MTAPRKELRSPGPVLSLVYLVRGKDGVWSLAYQSLYRGLRIGGWTITVPTSGSIYWPGSTGLGFGGRGGGGVELDTQRGGYDTQIPGIGWTTDEFKEQAKPVTALVKQKMKLLQIQRTQLVQNFHEILKLQNITQKLLIGFLSLQRWVDHSLITTYERGGGWTECSLGWDLCGVFLIT